MKTLPSARLSLRDRLSHLTFIDACKLLGPEGKQLIQQNANSWEIDLQDDVSLTGDLFRVRIPPAIGETDTEPTVVTITLMAEARQRLHWNCTKCFSACEHVGAAFSLILEEKNDVGFGGSAAGATGAGREPDGGGTGPACPG